MKHMKSKNYWEHKLKRQKKYLKRYFKFKNRKYACKLCTYNTSPSSFLKHLQCIMEPLWQQAEVSRYFMEDSWSFTVTQCFMKVLLRLVRSCSTLWKTCGALWRSLNPFWRSTMPYGDIMVPYAGLATRRLMQVSQCLTVSQSLESNFL